MKANQAVFPIATMCRLLGVSSSGYYAWVARAPAAHTQADAALLTHIRKIHEWSRGTYGAPRIDAALAAEGLSVGRKRVARLMRRASLTGVSRRQWMATTVRQACARPAPDVVERHFSAVEPDRLWVADATDMPTWAGFLSLAVVSEVCSRRVVGWAMATHRRPELRLAARHMALAQRRPKDVMHHADHGSQDTSVAFGRRGQQMGVRPSRGSAGDGFDHARAESFFATLACARLDRSRFRTPEPAAMAVFACIEGGFNPHRRHSAIGYLSPMESERRHARTSPLPQSSTVH